MLNLREIGINNLRNLGYTNDEAEFLVEEELRKTHMYFDIPEEEIDFDDGIYYGYTS